MPVPRVLIIGQPFTNSSGGGITQANLFKNWDRDKLAVVCTIHMFSDINTEICRQYYILGNEEYKWIFPFSLLQRQVRSGTVATMENSAAQAKREMKTKASARSVFLHKYFYPFLEFIGIIHCISKIVLSDNLKKWINEFEPDIIYAQASTRETVIFCTQMQEFIQKPMIFHMMDDWPSTISEKGPFRSYWHRRIDNEFRVMLRRTSVFLSISDYMAEEYKRRYGKVFITFHNPIDLSFWKRDQRTSYHLENVPTIFYAGRVGTGIQTSLQTAAQAVENACEKLGMPIRFVLQTAIKPDWIDRYPHAMHTSMVSYTELPKIFAEADFLLLPYDFSEGSVKFIKYSMPTKAPEYMVSGTPVIVFGPGITAMVKDAVSNKWAIVVEENNPGKLSEAICNLVLSEDRRREIGQRAIFIAESKYNAEDVRRDFRKVVSSLAFEQLKKVTA